MEKLEKKMKKLLLLFLAYALIGGFYSAYAKDKPTTKPIVEKASQVKKEAPNQYSLEVTIRNIPKGQQTLFVPIKIDSMILDFDKVALEGLAAQNILAVASTSMDKVGTGIGLIKLDDSGLPETLSLKVLLKPIGEGQTTVSLQKVAEESALPVKGAQIDEDVTVTSNNNQVEVSESVEKGKKKLVLNHNKLTLNIQRPTQREESIFIPIIFNSKVVELDETFGHAIIAPGINAKSFSSTSLHEGGPGIEILLTDVAEKDFVVDVDLAPKSVGSSKLTPALPQKSHTAIVTGPTVEISPTSITVAGVLN